MTHEREFTPEQAREMYAFIGNVAYLPAAVEDLAQELDWSTTEIKNTKAQVIDSNAAAARKLLDDLNSTWQPTVLEQFFARAELIKAQRELDKITEEIRRQPDAAAGERTFTQEQRISISDTLPDSPWLAQQPDAAGEGES